METVIINLESFKEQSSLILPAHRPALENAASMLKNGGLVAFPTETVYGLGAIYSNETAVRGIFAVKGRPADNPLIVHIWSEEQLENLVGKISAKAAFLMERFWPGPLTIIFPKREQVPSLVTAGLDTVAVRMPSHPIARELLQLTGIPVAAPSANLSGRPSPTQGKHVVEDLNGKIDGIIDAGPCEAGIESTVISLAQDKPLILRPGTITREMIESVLKEPVETASSETPDRPQAPGMKYRHYAPKAPVFLFEGKSADIVEAINRRIADQTVSAKTVIISSTENLQKYNHPWVLDLGPSDFPAVAAQRIYGLLRFSDELNAQEILIEGTHSTGVGAAVLNRLRKAAGGNVFHVS